MAKRINKMLHKDPKRNVFIHAWIATYGNITESCKLTGISRQTYYRWIETDKKFKIAIESEDVGERFLDFLEEKLKDKIIGNDTTALIFALKCKGKKRGYVERTESKEVGDRTVNVNFSDDVKQWL